MSLDLYRMIVTVFAVMAASVNLSLAGVVCHRRALMPIVWRVFAWYATAVGASTGAAAWWRIHDTRTDAALNPGDFTVFLPTVGGFIAGMVAWRTLGKITALHDWSTDDE